jgi:tetratricopeptide (TPR) repeat protein
MGIARKESTMNRRVLTIFTLAVLLLSAATNSAGGEERVSRELANLLNQARVHLQAGQHDKVIQLLTPLKGKDHPSRRLMLGYAYEKLSDPGRAVGQYKAALELDPTVSAAGLALAQIYASNEQWPQAAEMLGKHANIDACPKNVLLLYTQVAANMKDRRLQSLLSTKGLARFPTDRTFKRLDLQNLLDSGNRRAARHSIVGLLVEEPVNVKLWKQLAFVQEPGDGDARKMSAIEAALLCDPTDMSNHRQFLAGQIGMGNFHTVIQHGKKLLAGAMRKEAIGDMGLLGLLIHAADMNRSDQTLTSLLSLVPDDKQTRAMQLAAARLALRKGKTSRASEILTRLITAGDTDPSVYLWAGHLAERTEDPDRAVVFYQQARKLTGPAADMATLYLARLHLGAKRSRQSAQLLAEHLKAHPQDTYARAMLALTRQNK